MTFVTGRATFNNSTATTIAALMPASIATGNTLIAVLAAGVVLDNTNWQALAGWTLQGQFASTDPSCGTSAVYTRTASGSEPASYTFTSATAHSLFAQVLQYTPGVFDVMAGNDDNVGNNPVGVASVNASQSNDMLIVVGIMYANANIAGVTTGPAGMTSRQVNDDTPTWHQALYSWDQQLVASGATGAKSITYTTNNARANNLSIAMHP
jgi:hypothetical protein